MHEDIYLFKQETWDGNGITFVMTGTSYCDGSYLIRRFNSDVTVVEYILEGEGTIEIDGTVLHPKKGDSYLIPQGSDHTYYSSSTNPWTKIWVNLSGDLTDKLIDTYGLRDKHLFKDLYLGDLLDGIIMHAKNDHPYQILESGKLVYEIFYRIHNHVINKKIINSPSANLLINYINDRINEPITLTDLASYINKSEQQCIRIFKTHFNITPYQYILDKKIEMAKLYLKNTPMSIRDISFKLSFSDEFYFSNIFKKKTGIAPSTFRHTYTVNINNTQE